MKPSAIVSDALAIMAAHRTAISEALVGRRVRVTSDHNGQPYGRSRKSWRGEECLIHSVYVDLYGGKDNAPQLQLFLTGHEYECAIPADEVEFV